MVEPDLVALTLCVNSKLLLMTNLITSTVHRDCLQLCRLVRCKRIRM